MDLKWWACHRNASKPAAFQFCYQKQRLKAIKHAMFSSRRADPVHLLRDITWTSAYKGEPHLKKRAKRSRGSHPSRWKTIMERYHGKICSADRIGEEKKKSLNQVSASVQEFARSWATGMTSSHHQWDGRYQPLLPPGRFLLHLKEVSLFPLKMGRGMLQVVFQPKAGLWWPVSKAALASQADLAGTSFSLNIRLKTLICSRSKQNPNQPSKPTTTTALVYPKQNTKKMPCLNSQTQGSQDTVHDTSLSAFEGRRLGCGGFFSVLQQQTHCCRFRGCSTVCPKSPALSGYPCQFTPNEDLPLFMSWWQSSCSHDPKSVGVLQGPGSAH